MQIECLIKREAPTTIVIGGFRYEFEELKDGAAVCEVMSPEHQNWLLRMPSFYRKYAPRHSRSPAVDAAGDIDKTEEVSDEGPEEESDISPDKNLPPPAKPDYCFRTEEEARAFFSSLKINHLWGIVKDFEITLPAGSKKEDIVNAIVKVAYDQR